MESLIINSYGNGDGYGNGYGDGDGYGNGNGYGYGNGNGDGDGDGYGDGYGYGYGNGYGDGYGYGIKEWNSKPVKIIDAIPTIIVQKRGSVIKGFTFGEYYNLIPCTVVECDGVYAHGKDLHDAMRSLQEKLYNNKPEADRIREFWKNHNCKELYTVEDFYTWHHILTGSCMYGREQFAQKHNLTMDEKHTVEWFYNLTKDAYGGDVIRHMWEKRVENDE